MSAASEMRKLDAIKSLRRWVTRSSADISVGWADLESIYRATRPYRKFPRQHPSDQERLALFKKANAWLSAADYLAPAGFERWVSSAGDEGCVAKTWKKDDPSVCYEGEGTGVGGALLAAYANAWADMIESGQVVHLG